jgi:hypothetical protein
MRAIRVVGLTEDGEVVLEDPVRLERYTVPADERLRAAARGDLSRLGQIAIELESQLRPREIQARIRAGASVEQVAAAAGVPEQRIERFAYPVLLERSRTADVAQRAHPMRGDGPDGRTLGEVVAHTFGLRGHTYEGARWDSWKGEDGRWVIALGWRAGRSDNRAHWTFQPGAHGGTVTALDEHASDLVEGLPARPLRTVGPVIDMTRTEEDPSSTPSPVEEWRAAASDSYRDRMPHGPEAGRPAVDRGAGRTAPEPWRTAPQRQAESAVEAPAAEPRGDQRSGEPSASHSTADAGSSPSRAGADWAPWDRSAAAEGDATAPPEPARAESAPVGTSLDENTEPASAERASVEPEAAADDNAPETATDDAGSDAAPDRPDPLPVGEPVPEAPAADDAAPAAPGANRRTKKGKPVMPSWDEVLLGVRGPR